MGIIAKNIIVLGNNNPVEEFVAPQPPKIEPTIVNEVKVEEPKPEIVVAKEKKILRKKFNKEREQGLLFDHGEKSPYHMDMLTKENE
mgnify:CR=1 FL=1